MWEEVIEIKMSRKALWAGCGGKRWKKKKGRKHCPKVTLYLYISEFQSF